VLVALLALQPPANAQSLTFSLFERYLDSLRVQAGIPGLSALISQNGKTVWAGGFGKQSVDGTAAPTLDTPYLIGGLSQTFASTLLLKKCFDEGYAELLDKVARWEPNYPEPSTTLLDLLTHKAPGGGFRYDPVRFNALTEVVEECGKSNYSRLLADEIFDRLGMADSVPGHALVAPTLDDRQLFSAAELQRFADVIRRVAAPHRVDSRGRAIRTEVAPVRADASAGIISTASDLARFDAAITGGVLLEPATLAAAWRRSTNGSTVFPTGLGWFVQSYQGEPIVWQFGVVNSGYSSLLVKAPNRGTTLILLANSDGLTAPFALENGDITTSPFAQLFLRLLVP
jgi:CubicO group peptidase (beta-lactamase class C family)